MTVYPVIIVLTPIVQIVQLLQLTPRKGTAAQHPPRCLGLSSCPAPLHPRVNGTGLLQEGREEYDVSVHSFPPHLLQEEYDWCWRASSSLLCLE